MKSIAAYYAFIAMTSLEQDAFRRQTELKAAKAPRPSLLVRARTLFASARANPSASSIA
jgi:hypothetical protein